jgi:hypothetical protein
MSEKEILYTNREKKVEKILVSIGDWSIYSNACRAYYAFLRQ